MTLIREPCAREGTPGPDKPLACVADTREAIHLALARCTYHEQRHPALWSTEHIADYLHRALELLPPAAERAD